MLMNLGDYFKDIAKFWNTSKKLQRKVLQNCRAFDISKNEGMYARKHDEDGELDTVGCTSLNVVQQEHAEHGPARWIPIVDDEKV